jgi:uncharacterized protein (TIRG00374 family)
MLKKVIPGILIGSLLIYLSLKGIDLTRVVASIKATNPLFLLVTVVFLLLIQCLRSYRWGVILSPIAQINQLSLFSITSVGFLAVVTIPIRIGELARPYLINSRENITMTAAVGTILVERVFDSMTILIMFFILMFFLPLPLWLVNGSLIFFLILILISIVMTLLIARREATLRLIQFLLKKLPDKIHISLTTLLDDFIDGFSILKRGNLIYSVAFLSIIIWLFDAAAIYTLFYAFGFHLPPSAAFAVMVIIIVGIMIPTAPGFVGNWHYFTILGLTLFNISKVDALTYAIVLHFLSVGVIVLLGLIFLPFIRVSFSEMRQRFRFNHRRETPNASVLPEKE